jgi:ABC-type multidrug transport system permease subunit
MAVWSRLLYSVGNIAFGVLLILLLIMTRKNVPKVRQMWQMGTYLCLMVQSYTTYNLMTGILTTIAVGLTILLILVVIVIAVMIWNEPDPSPPCSDDNPSFLSEVLNTMYTKTHLILILRLATIP